MLSAKVLDRKGGPGQIAIDKRIALDAEQVRELDRRLEQAAFWTMPTEEKRDVMVEDGDHLIVEGVKGGTYHIVRRILPEPAYTKLCWQMLDLTGLSLREVWVGYHGYDDCREMSQ